MLTASQSVGSIIGGTFFGWLADTKGRLYALKVTNTMYIIFTIVLISSVNIYMVIACILFIGIAYSGDNMNTSTMLLEFLPVSRRWIITLFAINWGIGGIIMAFLGVMLNLYEVDAIYIFRIVCAFILLSVIVLLILRCFLDESPKFFL